MYDRRATLAQLVERLIRNQQVAGSIPAGGSRIFIVKHLEIQAEVRRAADCGNLPAESVVRNLPPGTTLPKKLLSKGPSLLCARSVSSVGPLIESPLSVADFWQNHDGCGQQVNANPGLSGSVGSVKHGAVQKEIRQMTTPEARLKRFSTRTTTTT
jgi:hypothetical protein